MRHSRNLLAFLLATAASTVPSIAATGVWTPFGPEGGGPQVIAADPRSASTLYAAFPWGPYSGLETLVMRSDDGGTSWQESNGGLEGKRIMALAVDPQGSGVVFGVVAVQGCTSSDPGGVYRTSDAGAHWELVATPQNLGGIACSSSALALSDAVLVGARDGVGRSSDGGATWQKIPLAPAPEGIHTLLRDPADERILYAASLSALFKSVDGGLSWTTLDDPAAHLNRPITGLAISRSDPRTLYEYGGLIWRSRDGGATWSAAMTGAPAGDGFYRVPLQVDPRNADTVFLGATNGVWASRDGGATFHLLHRGLPDAGLDLATLSGVTALELDAAQRLLLGTPTGLWSSTDAGFHWTAAALHGVHANAIDFLRFDPFDRRHFVFTNFLTLLETRDGGETFSPLSVPRPGVLQALEFDPFQPGRIVALTASETELTEVYRVFASTDGGHQWGAPSSAPRGASDLAVPAPNSLLVVAGPWVYLRRGSTGGWRKVLQGDVLSDRDAFNFTRLLSHPNQRGTLFALGFDNVLHSGSIPALYRSLDAGLHWKLWQDAANTLAFDPHQANIAYTESGGTVYRKRIDTGGAQRLGRISPLDLLTTLLVDRGDPQTFYAATANSGILVSHDDARHWSLLAPGLPLGGKDPVSDLEQDRLNPLRLYSTPVTGGLWRLDLEPH
ncbi:MAG TPA: hypothetical protein VH988_01670 [Thermoanaerobaculia bacterium]|nr:hypothetical protein [Thermoanaerobaculia bacterium]